MTCLMCMMPKTYSRCRDVNMPYVHDAMWQPESGHQHLRSLPEQGTKPSIAVVKTTDSRELNSLESFIQMKKKCISKWMYV